MNNFGKGNVKTKKPNGDNGWIFGNLPDNKLPYPWSYEDFFIKWADLEKGKNSEEIKPGEKTTTISILIRGGPHKITLYPGEQNEENYILENEGDYVFWGPNIAHTWEALGDNLTITLRWKVNQ